GPAGRARLVFHGRGLARQPGTHPRLRAERPRGALRPGAELPGAGPADPGPRPAGRAHRPGQRGPAPDPDVTCPSCGAPTGAEDSFCEACGTELAVPVTSSGAPGYRPECPVCSVDPSAPPAVISAEGYCESCGRKVPSGRDRSELDLGPLAGVSDRGLRHARNEDAMALAAGPTPGGQVAIAVVCDGVSSSPQPDEASLAAAQAAVRALLTSARRGDDPEQASVAAVALAHQALVRLGSPRQAPSATYVSAVLDADAVTLCWLGD